METKIFYCNHKSEVPKLLVLGSTEYPSLSENDYVYIQIIAKHLIKDKTYLYLGDHRFDLYFEKVVAGDYYYSATLERKFSIIEQEKFCHDFKIDNEFRRFTKVFINSYGRCEIELETDRVDNFDTTILTYVEIISDKIGEVNIIIEYLFEKDFFFWSTVGLTKNIAGEKEKISNNVLWKIISVNNYAEQLITEFITVIPFNKFYKLIPNNEITHWQSNEVIDELGISWLLENLNSLEPSSVYEEGHFLLLNRPYKPINILAEKLFESTDVYENKLIHWFINDIRNFILKCKGIIEESLVAYSTNSQFKQDIYKRYFKRLLDFVLQIDRKLATAKFECDTNIGVHDEYISALENQRIESKDHYYNCYINIINWIDKKKVSFQPDILFAGIKDLSKLYEIFCLYRLKDALISLGFSSVNSCLSRKIDDIFDDQEYTEAAIHRQYFFTKSEIEISLYYEQLPLDLTSIAKTGARGFRPDFILEIHSLEKKFYIIMDAKYKKIGSIENYEYSDLALKYLHGIGNKSGRKFNVLGLFILNPIDDSKTQFYQNNNFDLNSQKVSLPIIGRIEVSTNFQNEPYLISLLSTYLANLNGYQL